MFAQAYADFNALELMEGISLAATIVSMAFTCTPAHVEDMLQGAVNDLVGGAWKTWYIVDPAKAGMFKGLLSSKYIPHALQQLFKKRLRPILSAQYRGPHHLPATWVHGCDPAGACIAI